MTTTLAAPVPGVPDFGWLAGLEPGVAYAALATIVIVMGLIYLGPGIRDRLRPQQPPPAASESAQLAAPEPPAVAAAVAQEQEVTARFIDHLQAQIADLERDLRQERAGRERDRVEIDRLQSDLDRSTWRRGEQ